MFIECWNLLILAITKMSDFFKAIFMAIPYDKYGTPTLTFILSLAFSMLVYRFIINPLINGGFASSDKTKRKDDSRH